jgi:tRNA threonylcarbamoyladenosine biosynthesis protein TsaB
MNIPPFSGPVLGIETSGPSLSIALGENQTIPYAARVFMERAHNPLLGELVEAGLAFAGWKPGDLQALVLSAGPGSYTGLRIGTSFAKGMCFGLGIPLFPHSSLAVLCRGVRAQKPLTCAVLAAFDARRDEVYLRIEDAEGGLQAEDQPAVLGHAGFPRPDLDKPLVLAGSGAEKIFRFFGEPQHWTCLDNPEPEARHLLNLFFEGRVAGSDFLSFEPWYLKPVHVTTPRI